jgi:hypothetical protein
MTRVGRCTAAFLGLILALTACGTLSPSASPHASATNEPPSQLGELPAVVCVSAPIRFKSSGFDLNGAREGNDGGVYYLRQIGSVVWWNGMSGRDSGAVNIGRDWNNVARGVISGLKIDVDGADVPRGGSTGGGRLVLKIQGDEDGNIEMVMVVDDWGEFGSSVWTPCRPVEQQIAHYLGMYGGTIREYADILGLNACDKVAEAKDAVTNTMNTQEAGSPEFRTSLGYSNAFSDREVELNC